METIMTVTRFAPSPTGALHIGGVRTALFNYIHAKQNNGIFLIRIEDTDQDRSKLEYEENILNGLKALDLIPDKPPVRQSERSQLYIDAANTILDNGKAYYCDCSKERLEEIRTYQQKKGLKPQYDGKCRDLNLSKSDHTVLRLKTPKTGEVKFIDLVRGEVIFSNSELDDLILLRSDGTPTYHLCNVVDDFEQQVTTVIRGEDHLSNTPRQIHIQDALEYSHLEYAHLPLVLGSDKKRLSKRNAATSLDEYIDKGYLPSAMINMLARLGWSKGDKEIFYLDNLIKDFRIQEVQKAGAIFDLAKLDWINSQHLAALSDEDFLNIIKPFLESNKISDINKNYTEIVLALRTSAPNLKNISDDLLPYFNDLDNYNEKAVKKFLLGSENVLEFVHRKLTNIKKWDTENLDTLLSDSQHQLDLSIPKVNQPIRIALTGSTQSPSLGLTLTLFGRDESIKRIDNAIKFLKNY